MHSLYILILFFRESLLSRSYEDDKIEIETINKENSFLDYRFNK